MLLHYNGHGVPRPTANGEIWVFNKSYTQYIPLSIFDLRAWTGTPAIYVFDCSNAGLIIKSFLKLQQQAEETPSSQAVMRDLESRQAGGSMAFAELSENRSDLAGPSGFGTSESSSSANECILIARGAERNFTPIRRSSGGRIQRLSHNAREDGATLVLYELRPARTRDHG